ncbi:MAG: hypothetical protein JXB88_11160 [Spirochaetales bacterium]|nr:hypothetical protein [Spirochaetales bacterium]
MNNNEQKLFEFHFKMDVKMKEELRRLDLYKQEGSISQLVVKIFSLLSPHLEKEHFTGKQRMSKYELVNDDRKISRESVHVYFPDSLYRRLKAIHHDLNFYSIAQLVRMMLRMFLDWMKKYGNILVKAFLYMVKWWEERNEEKKYIYKPIRQLLHFIYQKPVRSRFLTIYDDGFYPVDTLRL